MIDILLKNVVLNGNIRDVAIENGIFSSISENISLPALKVIDAKGRYAITPAFYNTGVFRILFENATLSRVCNP